MAVKLSDSTFEQEVIGSELPVLVDFWATWCGPCLAIAPSIEQLSDQFDGRMKVAKLDIDENQETAMKYGIRSIPTLLIFKDGRVVDQIVGALPKSTLAARMERALSL